MNRIFPLVCLMLTAPTLLFSQQEADQSIGLSKVIPVSPNAASLGAFGDVPVSYFTGLPNISVPMFDYGSGALKSAISLSYHGGGLKVSEVASWVGAGWSLNAGGVITRTVRGLPDEYTFFSPEMKVKFLIENADNPAYKLAIRDLKVRAGKGDFDTEPDIFYYNVDNHSGKFYFNQEDNKFYTVAKSNVVITYTPNVGFTLVLENGNRYMFTEKEYTHVRTLCNYDGPDNPEYGISSWFLKRVENSNNTDFIDLEYNNSAYSVFKTTASSTSYLFISRSGPLGDMTVPQDQHCYGEISIQSKKLSKITFRDGYILFTTNTSRCDLIGEKALDKIELFDYTGLFKKRFIMEYGYLGGLDQPANCTDEEQAVLLRLKLKSVREESMEGSTVVQKNPYQFSYENEGDAFPSRNSFAQDYWGYYNGQNLNFSLMPDLISGSSVQLPSGNNRRPDPVYTKYGTLKRVTYPTKGYTDYFFENNYVSGPYLPQLPVYDGKVLTGDQVGTQTYYEATFTINEQSGGTYGTLSFGLLGCEVDPVDYYDYPGLRCADLKLEGLTPGTVSKDVSPNYTPGLYRNTLYLPNGTYKMSAKFIQTPAAFQNFFYEWTWQTFPIPPTVPPPAIAGGLRIAKMVDFDGVDHANDKVKSFEYIVEDGRCSGGFIGPWSNSFENYFDVYDHSATADDLGIVGHRLIVTYLKRTSNGNYTLLASGGSYVGYKGVYVHNGANDENGKTYYQFTFGTDDILPDFPFPFIHRDWNRGEVQLEKIYKKEPAGTSLLQSTENIHDESSIVDPNDTHPQMGLKVGFIKRYIFDGVGLWDQWYGLDYMAEGDIPVTTPYETITGWSRNGHSIVTLQSGAGDVVSETITDYNTSNEQPKQIQKINSLNETLITKTTYPVDYTGTTLPGWLQYLQQKNYVTLPIEKTLLKKLPDGTLYVISSTLTTYKPGQAVPDEIYSLDLSEPILLANFTAANISSGVLQMDSRYKKRLSFNSYDTYGNILEQQNVSDVPNAYVWGYNNCYPIAEAKNALVKDIFHTSFEDAEGNSADGDSKAGKKSRTGGYSKSLTNLTNGQYLLSYWQKTGSTWALQKQIVTVSGAAYTISISGQIDDVRFHPVNAQMSTYTYEPLAGMTSTCDINNTITYYEYDGLGRLKLLRDEDGNIIKTIRYNYKQ